MIPYTYLLKFCNPITNETLFYYGVQYGKNSNPKDLWKKYFSSSDVVKGLIQKYGKDSFEFQIRKTFTNAEKAKLWEHKVLKRLDIKNKHNWINLNDNIGPPILERRVQPFLWKTTFQRYKTSIE